MSQYIVSVPDFRFCTCINPPVWNISFETKVKLFTAILLMFSSVGLKREAFQMNTVNTNTCVGKTDLINMIQDLFNITLIHQNLFQSIIKCNWLAFVYAVNCLNTRANISYDCCTVAARFQPYLCMSLILTGLLSISESSVLKKRGNCILFDKVGDAQVQDI